MKKRNTIIYWIATGIFSAHMLMNTVVYFAMHDMVVEMFENLGFPAALVYPLAIAKFIGVVVILWNKSRILKHLAYAGFALDFILASSSHLITGHGDFIAPLFALLVMTISFVFYRRLLSANENQEKAD